MSKVRTYELNACTLHGCDCEEPVTAIDARDVEPLVEAARFMCRATAGTVNARGSREAEKALRIFDKAADALAEAVRVFDSSTQEGE